MTAHAPAGSCYDAAPGRCGNRTTTTLQRWHCDLLPERRDGLERERQALHAAAFFSVGSRGYFSSISAFGQVRTDHEVDPRARKRRVGPLVAEKLRVEAAMNGAP